ncbi:MAG: hypothetical protein FJ104_09335 [Deltaproteobacteria bacterium]|nr:hypothetical protein [Deltaproteobacteria bacterium]
MPSVPVARRALAAAAAALAVLVPAAAHAEAELRRPGEIWLAVGLGDAVCGDDRPDSDCPVKAGSAFALGGGWRFHPHWLVGLELAGWSFGVNDGWRGQLEDPATDVTFGASQLALLGRWYWFDSGAADPYLELGLAPGTVTGEAKNGSERFETRVPGLAWRLGIGVEWHLAPWFRLGPGFLAALHRGSEICESGTYLDGESCRGPGRDPETGDREGMALPYRLTLNATFLLGER